MARLRSIILEPLPEKLKAAPPSVHVIKLMAEPKKRTRATKVVKHAGT